ncbi:MAG: TlyA family RNA methyltransferase [Propionibacteriaceae bacterium]|jgi:23S rRNA (cytidine1920-2'-O)/16S rRNA (cytidine1409-2'-O)-methyltransferase|nr:TlyA family RNA methyltransferase [Propionibacteriaceae bacterium]
MTTRLDRALVERGLARSRGQAADLIAQGRVWVDGRPALKASAPIGPDNRLEAVADRYVSRAAHKLLAALDQSGTSVPERVLDAGASTGGFTQVLLERGARRVYAVDVGFDQLAPTLRGDPRVVVWERTNLRQLGLEQVEGQPVDLVVADVSFISLRLLLDRLFAVATARASALLLVKPQFEVGRGQLSTGGLVRDPAQRRRAVDQVAAAVAALGWTVDFRAPSVLPGTNGNQEFFLRCRAAAPPQPAESVAGGPVGGPT